VFYELSTLARQGGSGLGKGSENKSREKKRIMKAGWNFLIFLVILAAVPSRAQNWSLYVGSWVGSWNNQTAGTTGPIDAEISGKSDSDTFQVFIKTFGVFGYADTLRLNTTGVLDREMGLAQLTIPSPITGMILFSGTQVNGGLAGYGVNVALNGTHSDSAMSIQYTLSGLKKGNGTIELKRAKPTSVHDRSVSAMPLEFKLEANYPNPFNPHTTIEFALALSGPIELTIFNLIGQPVRVLVAADLPAGRHGFSWDGLDERGVAVPSGIYFYRLEHPDFSRTRRMQLIK
jgi:hypothetical protein